MIRLTQEIKLVVIAILMALPITTTADDISSRQKELLFEKLAHADTEQAGRLAEDAIWQFWFSQSPSADVRVSLDAGIERREAYDFEAAELHLDAVVSTAPRYAEGYNQRAFIRFLRENYQDALTDLEMALELEPDHFGALSGMFHTLQNLSRPEAAMKKLQRAVEIHPWIKERGSLPESMWSEKYRRIHEPGQEI